MRYPCTSAVLRQPIVKDHFSSYFTFCVTIFTADRSSVYIAKYDICVVCLMELHPIAIYSVNVFALFTTQKYVLYGRKRIYRLVLVYYYTILHLINRIGRYLYEVEEGFSISKFANHQISNTEKRHGLNSAGAKHLPVRQTLECSHFITPQTRSSQGFPSLILFSLLAHTVVKSAQQFGHAMQILIIIIYIRSINSEKFAFASPNVGLASPLNHIRMLILLLDSRVNIFHTNDLKAIVSLENVRNLDRHRRKYIACFYS